MFDFEDQVVLVTGGGSGIGAATCAGLVECVDRVAAREQHPGARQRADHAPGLSVRCRQVQGLRDITVPQRDVRVQHAQGHQVRVRAAAKRDEAASGGGIACGERDAGLDHRPQRFGARNCRR